VTGSRYLAIPIVQNNFINRLYEVLYIYHEGLAVGHENVADTYTDRQVRGYSLAWFGIKQGISNGLSCTTNYNSLNIVQNLENIMFHNLNSAVGIFNNPHDVEIAINELQKKGYDLKKLSMVGGLLITWIVSTLVLDSPLASLGLPHSSIRQYDRALKSNKFLLIVHGDLPEVEQATDILRHNHAEYANYHRGEVNIISERV